MLSPKENVSASATVTRVRTTRRIVRSRNGSNFISKSMGKKMAQTIRTRKKNPKMMRKINKLCKLTCANR